MEKVKVAVMTVQEIATRYHAMAQTGQYAKIQDELYASDCVSVESENYSDLPIRVVGFAAMRQKEGKFFQQVEAMHGGYCHEPLVCGSFFTCAQGMDVTMKGQKRKQKDQLAVFEVVNGKIALEHFFYADTQ
jgi:hypothetical protein